MTYFIGNKENFIDKLTSFFELNNLIPKKLFVLVDENTSSLCLPSLLPFLSKTNYTVINCHSGENYKTIEVCCSIWQQLLNLQCDRHSLIIVLGGGMLCDIGAFIASTFKRGIDFILIPTTLLAQTDAAFGGKTGVNFNNIKNQIGTFCFPTLTAVNTDFLHSLPSRQLHSGFAEIIKHGLIGDSTIIDNFTDNIDNDNFINILRQSIAFKLNIVNKDYKEINLRKVLNFGHTVGHAVESSLTPRFFHGEAVAFGMITALLLSKHYCHLNDETVSYGITTIIDKIEIPMIQDSDIEQIISAIVYDKKNFDGKINFVLLEALCQPVYDIAIKVEDIKKAISATISLFGMNNHCEYAQDC